MAYDLDLADRIRALLVGDPGVTEKAMFGGLAFLVEGKMAVAAAGQGDLMVRIDPALSAELIKTTPAEAMIMRERPMSGWLLVPAVGLATPSQLEEWIDRGTEYARSLPAKTGR